jgi:hypothetical protein
MKPPLLASPRLTAAGLAHGFFGRAGGVSTGIFSSLNTGLGTSDDADAVLENRARCTEALGVSRLVSLHQVHSAEAVVVQDPWTDDARPRADALVTDRPGIALGVLAADCMPFLFADPEAGVIGAAHAGWRGALDGVLQAAVGAMTKLGAKPFRIVAALGPCLRQPNFEVGPDLVEAFTLKYPDTENFFAPGAAPDKRQFDLAGFARRRLAEIGVDKLDDLDVCTLGAPGDWFSYRASRRASEADYGRNLSAIARERT